MHAVKTAHWFGWGKGGGVGGDWQHAGRKTAGGRMKAWQWVSERVSGGREGRVVGWEEEGRTYIKLVIQLDFPKVYL